MRLSGWRLVLGLLLICAIGVLAYLNRGEIAESLALFAQAQPIWIGMALVVEQLSFICAALVYRRILKSFGVHISMLRLWAIALVTIVLSQSVPAGGVASYAFLIQSFRRHGVSAGQATLLASLEALSYAVAMLLLFFFSVFYLGGVGADGNVGVIAALSAVLAITTVVFIITRTEAQLTRWALAIKNGLARVLRQRWSDERPLKLVGELVHARALFAERRGELIWLVLIQFIAQVGHSLTMLLVLRSLGGSASVFVVMSAFGIALMTSTFNILPGGGGTVETAIVLTLRGLGVDEHAIGAAVLFRLLNFWLMLPVIALCYRWLMHGSLPADLKALSHANEADGAPRKQEAAREPALRE